MSFITNFKKIVIISTRIFKEGNKRYLEETIQDYCCHATKGWRKNGRRKRYIRL